MVTQICELGAISLRAAIATKAVSCREVMAAYLARIEAVNPRFNALISLRDPDQLLAEAVAADATVAHGASTGPLHGFPQAPKDLVATRGLRTTMGSPLYADDVPAGDALLAERLREAGAIFIGKSNTPEFGLGGQTYNAVFGVTGNAFDPELTAGGSSGGAAVAVAQRLLPCADGSDMMGSLRNPAGWNGIVGFRPTQGRVPRLPQYDLYLDQFASDGPMARTVADAAFLLSVMAGFDARQPQSLPGDGSEFLLRLDGDCRDLRIGYLGDLGGHLAMDDGILDVVHGALSHFADLGCAIEPIVPAFDFDQLWDAWIILRSFAIANRQRATYADPVKRALLKPEMVWEIETGLDLTAEAVFQASSVRSQWYGEQRRLFERFDALVLPTAQVFPFPKETTWPRRIGDRKMDTYHRWMEVVLPATLGGGPVICVPAGFDATGRPMGLQIMGPVQADLAILQLAHAYEQASGFSKVRPPDR